MKPFVSKTTKIMHQISRLSRLNTNYKSFLQTLADGCGHSCIENFLSATLIACQHKIPESCFIDIDNLLHNLEEKRTGDDSNHDLDKKDNVDQPTRDISLFERVINRDYGVTILLLGGLDGVTTLRYVSKECNFATQSISLQKEIKRNLEKTVFIDNRFIKNHSQIADKSLYYGSYCGYSNFVMNFTVNDNRYRKPNDISSSSTQYMELEKISQNEYLQSILCDVKHICLLNHGFILLKFKDIMKCLQTNKNNINIDINTNKQRLCQSPVITEALQNIYKSNGNNNCIVNSYKCSIHESRTQEIPNLSTLLLNSKFPEKINICDFSRQKLVCNVSKFRSYLINKKIESLYLPRECVFVLNENPYAAGRIRKTTTQLLNETYNRISQQQESPNIRHLHVDLSNEKMVLKYMEKNVVFKNIEFNNHTYYEPYLLFFLYLGLFDTTRDMYIILPTKMKQINSLLNKLSFILFTNNNVIHSDRLTFNKLQQVAVNCEINHIVYGCSHGEIFARAKRELKGYATKLVDWRSSLAKDTIIYKPQYLNQIDFFSTVKYVINGYGRKQIEDRNVIDATYNLSIEILNTDAKTAKKRTRKQLDDTVDEWDRNSENSPHSLSVSYHFCLKC